MILCDMGCHSLSVLLIFANTVQVNHERKLAWRRPGLFEEIQFLFAKYAPSPPSRSFDVGAPKMPSALDEYEEEGTLPFVPMDNKPCFGQLPCLHTTSQDRLRARCHRSIWIGKWEDTSFVLGNKSLHVGGQSYKMNNAGLSNRYKSDTALECDLADLLLLSSSPYIHKHMNDASERHLHLRLQGLRNKLWVMIGDSVDHMNINLGCPLLFGTEKTSILSTEKDFSGLDERLTLDICTSTSINFTMAYVFVDGFSTTTASRNRTIRAMQYAGLDRTLRSLGWPLGPDFVTMGGMVWDIKHWIDAHAAPDWKNVSLVISMQIELLQNLWPHMKGIFLRTHFECLRSRHGKLYLSNQGLVEQYNSIMHKLSSNATELDLCGKVLIADMRKLMIHHGQSSTGWSDGIHPAPWVSLQYVSLLANIFADLGDACK